MIIFKLALLIGVYVQTDKTGLIYTVTKNKWVVVMAAVVFPGKNRRRRLYGYDIALTIA